MCMNHSKKRCCINPEQRKTETGNCSAGQIKECHGDDKRHPCENDKNESCEK